MAIVKTWTRCPHCGQSVAGPRFGVQLRPIQVRVLDAIVRAGPDGIASDDLREMIWGDVPTAPSLISAHVCQINTMLAPRGQYKIMSNRRTPGNFAIYRIERCAVDEVA